jgi:hypothetical protein
MSRTKMLTKEMLLEYGVTHVTEDGRVFKGEAELKQSLFAKKGKYKNQKPYARIGFTDKTQKIYNKKYGENWYCYKSTLLPVHRIVYAWFKGCAPKAFDIDHKDNNPLNNHIDNLEALTRTENNQKKKYSRNQYTYNLTDAEIEEKRKTLRLAYNRDLHKYVKAEWWKEEIAQRRFNKIAKKRAAKQWHKLVADKNDLISKRKQAKINSDINKWRELGVLINEINAKIIKIKKDIKIKEKKEK